MDNDRRVVVTWLDSDSPVTVANRIELALEEVDRAATLLTEYRSGPVTEAVRHARLVLSTLGFDPNRDDHAMLEQATDLLHGLVGYAREICHIRVRFGRTAEPASGWIFISDVDELEQEGPPDVCPG